MTARPIVLLDCDGVLSDFTSAMLRVVADVTGRTRAYHEVTSYDFSEALGLSVDDARSVKRAIGVAGFASTLQPYDGAKEAVAELRTLAEVFVVTSPWNSNPTWTHDREAWLKKHFDIRHDHVIHTSAKSRVHGDVFVDDKPDAVEAWCSKWIRGAGIVWPQPYNKETECWRSWRVTGWHDVLDVVTCKVEGRAS